MKTQETLLAWHEISADSNSFSSVVAFSKTRKKKFSDGKIYSTGKITHSKHHM